MRSDLDEHDKVLLRLAEDRLLAHETLFAHRHKNATPPFHRQMIRDFHSKHPNLVFIAFRGGAKSSRAEEAIIVQAMFREFQNCMIFGSSLDRACERLHAIRREFEKNEYIHSLFGNLCGQPWSDEKIELSTGIVIQAMGRGQSLRGTKEEIMRPDLIVADDIEDERSVLTPEAREKIQAWFLSEVLPAGDVNRRVRILANDTDPECLANRLDNAGSGFKVRRYPWIVFDEHGNEHAQWPDRFPLEYCKKEENRYRILGRMSEYNSNYMCQSTAKEQKPFRDEMFQIIPQVRTWQNVYCMFDPARTVTRTAATTGFAAWSFIGNRIVVWDAWARKLLPDEIVSAVFAANEAFAPAWIGVEEDGLNEFLLQPIRHEQLRRGVIVPLKPMKAPKGKLDFIRGLQPFFQAREVIFAKDLPDLRAQLLGFPTGYIDAPNALAYALKMRAGAPMYEDFSARHVAEDLAPSLSRTRFLAMNATRALTAGVLMQVMDKSVVRIYADFVREGEPRETVKDIVSAAQMDAGGSVRPIVAPFHFNPHNNFGLVQALRNLPRDVSVARAAEDGREEIRRLLKTEVRGMPAIMVSSNARLSLNAFAGGYARSVLKQGTLAEYADEGMYRVLMEGIESAIGAMTVARGADEDDGEGLRYAWTEGGRRYLSALPQRG